MNTFAKFAVAAAAVVVIAVIGFNLLPASSGVGGGSNLSPSPSHSPTLSPSSSLSPAAVFPPKGDLAIGQHAMTLAGVPLTFDVAISGWVSNGEWGIDRSTGMTPDGAGFIFWSTQTPVGAFKDPCADVKGPPLASAADLAAAVASLPGIDVVSRTSDVTVGGYPAKHVVITVREDVGCRAESFNLWYAPRADLARYASELGSTIRVWIVDVDGTLVWIDGETYKGAGTGPGQQIQQIVDSIRFESPNPYRRRRPDRSPPIAPQWPPAGRPSPACRGRASPRTPPFPPRSAPRPCQGHVWRTTSVRRGRAPARVAVVVKRRAGPAPAALGENGDGRIPDIGPRP